MACGLVLRPDAGGRPLPISVSPVVLAAFALLLGSMAAVNLWELPTYLGLGVLAFLISQFRGRGRIQWGLTLLAAALYAGAPSYSEGRTSLMLYLESQRTYFDTQADYFETLQKQFETQAELESAIGVPLDQLSQPPPETK